MITALVNGHARKCIIDTGATGTLMPHRGETLVQTLTETLPAHIFRSIGPPLPGMAPRPLTTSLVDSIQIGEYRVEGAPVVSFGVLPQDKYSPNVPGLGTNLFRNVSLTIDWASMTMVIASPASNMAPAQSADWDQVLTFDPKAPGDHGDGRVLLHGTIAGSPSLLLFDTGSSILPLWIIDRSLAKRLVRAQGSNSREEGQLLDDVSWSITGTQFHTSAFTDPWMTDAPFQALIGTQYLLVYRVGIDYPAHRLYLHKLTTSEHFYNGREHFTRGEMVERREMLEGEVKKH